MMTITKEDFSKIIGQAVNELERSFINKKDEQSYGWRNGFFKDDDPGATATAIGTWFYVSCKGEFEGGSTIDVYKIIDFILREQLQETLEDGNNKKTGWIVKSLNQDVEQPIASIDATATVINMLNSFCSWLDNSISPELHVRIKESVQCGVEWLESQIQDDKNMKGIKKQAWGIHKADCNRVFVTCNVLQAILPLVNAENRKVKKAITWLLDTQKEQSGCWDATKSDASSKGTIFHTAKTLNLLNKYLRYNNKISTDFARRIRGAMKKGMEFLHNELKNEYFVADAIIEEKCNDYKGDEKTYFHDQYNELLNFMFNTYGDWRLDEIFKVLDGFFTHYRSNESDFYSVDKSGHPKKQIWLLLPIARQLHQILYRHLPKFESTITCIDNCLLTDPTDKQKKNVAKAGKHFSWKKHFITISICLLIFLAVGMLAYWVFAETPLGKMVSAISSVFSLSGIGIIGIISLIGKRRQN